jgi:hypothetical protein
MSDVQWAESALSCLGLGTILATARFSRSSRPFAHLDTWTPTHGGERSSTLIAAANLIENSSLCLQIGGVGLILILTIILFNMFC